LNNNDLVNFKMRTGEDILGVLVSKHSASITVKHPMLVVIEPHEGLFVKSWNMLSEGDEVEVQLKEMIWCRKANKKAIDYHHEFMEQADEYLDDDDQPDDIYEDLLMSKAATKH
jgi:hypothetical protein